MLSLVSQGPAPPCRLHREQKPADGSARSPQRYIYCPRFSSSEKPFVVDVTPGKPEGQNKTGALMSETAWPDSQPIQAKQSKKPY
jgi:hypothetical protein